MFAVYQQSMTGWKLVTVCDWITARSYIYCAGVKITLYHLPAPRK